MSVDGPEEVNIVENNAPSALPLTNADSSLGDSSFVDKNTAGTITPNPNQKTRTRDLIRSSNPTSEKVEIQKKIISTTPIPNESQMTKSSSTVPSNKFQTISHDSSDDNDKSEELSSSSTQIKLPLKMADITKEDVVAAEASFRKMNLDEQPTHGCWPCCSSRPIQEQENRGPYKVYTPKRDVPKKDVKNLQPINAKINNPTAKNKVTRQKL
ncbi:MAG: hypothetical protein JSS07_00075 [Proteobacteria bacterium]|nr:hypothetical protein [Pseudomonadota bacterium]